MEWLAAGRAKRDDPSLKRLPIGRIQGAVLAQGFARQNAQAASA
jgi:hypothetical protein